MTEAFYDSLLNFGMGGLFIAFLIYNWLSNQKRQDAQLDTFTKQLKEQNINFQTQIKEIQDKSEQAEEKLRSRYDTVVGQYQTDKKEVTASVAEKLAETLRKIKCVEQETASLKVKTDSLEILSRDSLLLLQRINEAWKAFDEERKVKAMAKQIQSQRRKEDT